MLTKSRRVVSAEEFAVMMRDHEMSILHDDGLYRHLHCRARGHGYDWFDVVTWPGSLSFSGDWGDYTFSRTDDMLGFFAGKENGLPFSYWAEKAQSVDRRSGLETNSRAALIRVVKDRAKDMISDLSHDEDNVRRREITKAAKELIERIRHCDTWAGMTCEFMEFDQAGLRFDDWESIPDRVLVRRFYLACRCINWAANRYFEAKTLEGLLC